jgi:molybdopterin molybdotransferase
VSAPFEDLEADWLSVEAALGRVLAEASPLAAVRLAPSRAHGLILASDVEARATLPAHDNSAMDGYAVRSVDVRGASPDEPVRLEVVGHAVPGPPIDVAVGPGQAVRITTGGPVPAGSDSVVRVEHTDRESSPGVVEVRDDADAGRNVRPAGRDLRRGDVVALQGERLGPGRLGIVISAGAATVAVHPPPRVAVVATGDELAGPDELERVLAGNAVPDVNGPMISAAVQAAGGVARSGAAAPDDLEALVARLEQELDADLLVTIGGASMGTGDLVKRALDRLGFHLDFWRVTMRPGSPFGFGRIPREGAPPLPVCSLPGNPSSAFVTFELFVRPLIRRLAGHTRIHRPSVDAVAGEAFGAHPRNTMFPRVTLDRDAGEAFHARSAGDQTSGLVHTLARAHGLAVVRPSDRPIARGEPLRVLMLDDEFGAAEDAAWLRPLDGGSGG